MSDTEFYNKNGFLILKEYFSKDFCNKIMNEMRYWADKEYSSIMNPDRIEYLVPQCFKNNKKNLTDNVDDIERAINFSKIMRQTILNKRLLKKIDKITNSTIFPIGSHYFFKEPNTRYASQAWVPHQDNEWTKNPNNNLLLAHIIMDKSTVENGCIYLYPGSQKEPVLPLVKKPELLTDSLNPGRLINIPEEYLTNKFNCVLGKGDVVICHGNTIHGSYANSSTIGRPTYAIHYISEGEEFFSGERARRKIIKR